LKLPLTVAAAFCGLSYRTFRRLAIVERKIPFTESPLSTDGRRLYLFEKRDLIRFRRELAGMQKSGRGRPLGKK
jgi:hypothetical protein